jgi:hypothetical protein
MNESGNKGNKSNSRTLSISNAENNTYQDDNLNENNKDENNYEQRRGLVECSTKSFENRDDENNLCKLAGNINNTSLSSLKYANNSSTSMSNTNTNKKSNTTNDNRNNNSKNNNQELSKTIDLSDTSSCNSVCDMNFDNDDLNNNTEENVDDDIEADYDFELNESIDDRSSTQNRVNKKNPSDEVKLKNSAQMKRSSFDRTSDVKLTRAKYDTHSNRFAHNQIESECMASHKCASNSNSFAFYESSDSKQAHANSKKNRIKKHISFESDRDHLNQIHMFSPREIVNNNESIYRTSASQNAVSIPIKVETRANSNYDNICTRHNSLTPTDSDRNVLAYAYARPPSCAVKNDEPFYTTIQPTQPKKISNLKKMNSARHTKRADANRQVEKVKFNNVEMQHMNRTRVELNPVQSYGECFQVSEQVPHHYEHNMHRMMSLQPVSTFTAPILRAVDHENVYGSNARSTNPSNVRFKKRPIIKHSNTFNPSDYRKYRSNSCSARNNQSQESLIFLNAENVRLLRHPRSDYNIHYLNNDFDANTLTSSSESMEYPDYAHKQYVPHYNEYYELIRTTNVPVRSHHRKKKRRQRRKQIQFLETGAQTHSPIVSQPNQEAVEHTNLKFIKSVSNSSLQNVPNVHVKNPSQVIRINLRNDEQILRNNSVIQDDFQSTNSLRTKPAQQAQDQANGRQGDASGSKSQTSNTENMGRSASVSVNIVPNRNLKLVHPSSSAQTNRIMHAGSNEQDSDNLFTEIMHSTNYSDLLSENASIVDSPIHLLMSHHKNQRVLKDKELPIEFKRRFLPDTVEQLNDPIENEPHMEIISQNPRDSVPIQTNQMPIIYKHEKSDQSFKTLSSDHFNQEANKSQLNEEQQRDYKQIDQELVRDRKERIGFKRFAALMLAALITLSSVYLFELVSFILEKNNLNILAYRLSTFVTCIGFTLNSMYSKRHSIKTFQLLVDKKKSNDKVKCKYFDLFKNNEDNDLDSLNDDDGFILHYQPQTQSSSYLLNKNLLQVRLVHKLKELFALSARFNICWFVLSIMLVHLWILASYVLSYLDRMNLLPVLSVYETNLNLHLFLQILSASIGGFALAVFIRFIILCFYEMSCSNMLNTIQKLFECDSLYEKESKGC